MTGIRGIYSRNPLAFPGGAPGFDPMHPAARGISLGHGFSGVASTGGFQSLLNGLPATIAGTPSAAILSSIGSCTYMGALSTNKLSFAGQSTATDVNATLAVVVMLSSLATASGFFETSGTNAGWRIVARSSTGTFGMTAGGVSDFNSNITLSINVPYFVVASTKGGTSGTVVNYLVKNLLTGSVYTNVSTTGNPTASNGSYLIGTDGVGEYLRGYIAAAMFAPTFIALPILLAWAARPWDFWYPSAVQTVLFSGLRRKSTQTQVYGTIVG